MSENTVRTFEDLECWKACREVLTFVHREILTVLPKQEIYRLGDQLVRCSRSTTANIAEGYGRFHYLDNAKFCSNSHGSCLEVLDHLITAFDEKLISEALLEQGRNLVNTAIKLTNGYITYLQRAARSQ